IEKLQSWVEGAVELLPNLVVAILVLALFWGLSKIAGKVSQRGFQRLRINKAARGLMTTIVRVAVLVLGAVVALGVLNLDKALASILAGAGILGLALGFAFQDLAANLISGVGLAMNRDLPFKIGDIVETNGSFGTVREVHLRTSILESLDGQTIIIPNKAIYQDKVINYSRKGQLRVDVSCGVSYGDDLDKVKKVASEAIATVSSRDDSKDVELFFEEFGDSSINFVARFWVKYDRHTDVLGAKSEAIMRLKAAFDEQDVMIPFPIRTLDFGIRGGERLGEVLGEAGKKHSTSGSSAGP
ncbi:MAG: mechanosensitive ion channel, partial [Myxococcales bacterium]|nr:mechanosensitive ion channel [Myxococcales bacterium]